NGKLTVDATTLERGKNLRSIATEANRPVTILVPYVSGFRTGLMAAGSFKPAQPSSADHARRIRELYKIALSRKPTLAEEERLVKYLESGGPSGDRSKALADIFWALLNSPEFYFNH